MPRWHTWVKKARGVHVLKNATYPFPQSLPKFLGTVIQKCCPRSGEPTIGFQKWIDEINNVVASKLVPELRKIEMMWPDHVYENLGIGDDFCLATIPDFNTLIATSQEHQTPVFALTREQIRQIGTVLEQVLKSRDSFKGIFSDLAEKIVELTSHANSDSPNRMRKPRQSQYATKSRLLSS